MRLFEPLGIDLCPFNRSDFLLQLYIGVAELCRVLPVCRAIRRPLIEFDLCLRFKSVQIPHQIRCAQHLMGTQLLGVDLDKLLAWKACWVFLGILDDSFQITGYGYPV
jgi:hypothetical protein